MRSRVLAAFGTLCLMTIGSWAIAGDWTFAPNVGVKQVTGNTSYEINFPLAGVTYGRSKLKFDLDSTMLTLGGTVSYNAKYLDLVDSIDLSFNYATKMGSTSGTMQDQDWFYNVPGYSSLQGDTKSDLDSDAKSYDIRYRMNFKPLDDMGKFRLNASVGYLEQKWGQFQTRNVHGYYGPLLSGTGATEPIVDAFDNPLLTYEVKYKLPYLGIGFDWSLAEKLLLKAGVDYSTIAHASDRDDHVARQKLSKGDTNGDYMAVNAELDWNFHPNMILALEASYMTIDTTGTQHQYDYSSGVLFATDISDKIKSEQTYVGAKYIYEF